MREGNLGESNNKVSGCTGDRWQNPENQSNFNDRISLLQIHANITEILKISNSEKNTECSYKKSLELT